ncbi:MAG: tetratricopeptide repeat protein [Candidatus Freyarchaeota archaeon]|nr:tetratricopeptide repeat protein [Candidatus Jordarchaeia archaeon]MBS7268317.1 tetratricopeptide repeat protein [Candidatus Jordarchaeia archaeon]MBS7278316.1 tetratricopeptide repeat protein [Candidatus Jordarchaeia archaeon]
MDFLEIGRFYEKLAEKSLSFFKKDFKSAGYWYSSAADCYKIGGDEEKFVDLKNLALKYFLSLLEETKEKGTVDSIGQIYLWVSYAYRALGNLDEHRNFLIKAAKTFALKAKSLDKGDKASLQAIINYYNAANCYRTLGDRSEAEENYKNALKKYYRKGRIRGVEFSPVLLASCYYRLGDIKKAIEILEKESKKQNLPPLVFSNINLILGCYHLERGEKEEARRHFEEARIPPDTEKLSAPELVTQALCQLMLNNAENATGLADVSIRLSSKLRDYNLRQLIQEIGELILSLVKGQEQKIEKLMESLTWQHMELPLYDALNIITRKRSQ